MIGGKEAINIAFAGVGTPKNDSDCRVSRLNFASLRAENTEIINPLSEINTWVNGRSKTGTLYSP